MPKIAETDKEIERCFDVLSELRTHQKRETFLSTVHQMQSEGYRLAYIQENEKVVTVAGFRISTNFFMGKNLYVDDLVTSESMRSKRHGEELIEWLRNQAKSAGCNFFHLDSGTQRARAHKFYFQQGFTIASYHFSEELTKR